MKTHAFKRNFIVGFWAVAALVVSTYYNACGQVAFEATLESRLNQLKSTALILINKDATYANNDQVELILEARGATEMYVTNDKECKDGGQWEPLSGLRNWQLANKNQEAAVYAKFRNPNEGIETPCLSDTIIHDDQPPQVVLPASLATKVDVPVVNFAVTDALSGVDKQWCEWPGKQPTECNQSTSDGKLVEGRYLVKVKATDKAGNTSDPSLFDLIVDRTPPEITILSGPSVLTNNPMAAYAFNVVDDRAGLKDVECAFDAPTAFKPCVNSYSATLAEGPHKLYIRATDKAGNSADKTHDFTIDLTVPTVTITKYPNQFVNVANATLEFEGKDGNYAITVFECRLDAGAWASCASPRAYTGLSEGLHTFEVRGFDKAMNPSAPAARSWYIDLTVPTLTLIQTPDALTNSLNASFRYNVADVGSGVDRVECAVDAGAYAACPATGMQYAGLAAGPHSFRARVFDKAGNVSAVQTYNWTIDNTAPTVNFTAVPGPVSNLTEFLFKFEATDANGIARVECRLGGDAFAPCASMTEHQLTNLQEGQRRFAVRAVDRAGNMSAELAYTWLVDLTGPVITYFQMPPSSVLERMNVNLGFNVADSYSGVKSVTCTLDGQPTACTSGQLKTITAPALGNHTFVVTAEDNVGNTSTDTKTFTVAAPVLKNQAVDVKGISKVDILVVMDNSGSMAAEQANMGQRFGNFIDKIKTLDWQIGVVTTDVSANQVNRDGRLVELDGLQGQYILRSSMPMAQAQTVFSNTVQMGTDGSGNEQGFLATIRAIDRAFDSAAVNAPNRELFRADSALAVVVVSDAHDTSGRKPEDVVAKVRERFGNKSFTFHSIVVPESQYTDPNGTTRNPNDPCRISRENVKFDGREYHRLSDMTGGVKGTVCVEDYSSQLADMGKITAELVNSVQLDCQALDYNGDGKVDMGDVEVRNASGGLVTGFTVAGAKLTFAKVLPIGSNTIKYYCLP